MLKKSNMTSMVVCALSVFALLMTIAALFDLQISKALFSDQSFFGQYFAKTGEYPAYLILIAASAIFFFQSFGKNKTQKVLCKVVAVLAGFASTFLFVNVRLWDFVKEIDFAVVYQLVLSAILFCLTLLIFKKVEKQNMKKLFVFAVFSVVVVVVSCSIVALLKIVWERQRFRTMVGSGDFSGFTDWFLPSFVVRPSYKTAEYISTIVAVDKGAFKSFPSGHTVAASTTFVSILIPDLVERAKKLKWLFWLLPTVYTVAVAVSRIVVGAHFLSDVVFGGFVGFFVAFFAASVVRKKFVQACALRATESV